MSSPSLPVPARASRLPIQAIGAGLTFILIGLTAINILLAGAQAFELSPDLSSSLIVSSFGLVAILCATTTLVFRQPIVIGLQLTNFLFIMSLSDTYSYREVTGALFVSGTLIVVVAALGATERLSALIPPPIVFGILAGAIMPFVVGIFSDMSDLPRVLGLTVTTYLLARRFLPARVPAILPTMVVGFIAAEIGGLVNWSGSGRPFVMPTMVQPAFSWHAIVSIAPIVVILTITISNLPALVYLHSQGFNPPERKLHAATGIGTMVGALFGLNPVGMGSLIMPLVAGPDAGKREERVWSVYTASIGFAIIAVLGGLAAGIPYMVPPELIFAIAGLGLLGVLGQSLVEVTKGPLRLGPLFAFVITSSKLSLAGFGPAFWGLVIGLLVTLLLEQSGWQQFRMAATAGSAAD